MALLSHQEIARVPLYFTVALPDGSKDIRDFDATMPLLELLEAICKAKGWLFDEYLPKTMDDKDVDLDYVLGEVKEREIKLVHVSLFGDVAKPVEEAPKAEKRIKRMDRGKNAPAASGFSAAPADTSGVPVRRGLVRQNSYVSIKAWNPDEDEDEQESLRRVRARYAMGKSKVAEKTEKSPIVVAMEREHKATLDKLNLDGIKMPPPITSKELQLKKISDLNLSALDKSLNDLISFENIYGANHDWAPENFFKGLL